MDNNEVQPNVFNFNPEQVEPNVVDGEFDSDSGSDDNSLNSEIYERTYIRPFPPDKIQHVIGVAGLEEEVIYYKVILSNDNVNDTKYDITQLQFLRNQGGAIYWFGNKHGNKNIPLLSNQLFIPAYLMFPASYPKGEHDKKKFSSIYGIDDEETSIDKDSSDSDSDYSYDSEEMDLEDLEGGKKRRRNKKQKKFHFTSTQKHQHGGKKTVRHVSIKNGKGHKKVSHYRGNKLAGTVKKSLKKPEMEMIRLGKFIPGLFRDCQVSRKKSTTRRRRKKN
jgi:hypothetical protein